MGVDDFLTTLRQYTNATKITKRMAGELIDRIAVYHADINAKIRVSQQRGKRS